MAEEFPSIASIDSWADDLGRWLASAGTYPRRRDGVQLQPAWKPLYVVAVTARSGSTMLCSALRRIPELGQPEEYLNARGALQQFHREFRGRDLAEYLESVCRSRCPAGTLGIKTAYLDFRFLAESRLGPHLADCANFIYLTRRDIYAQAVSLWAARKTAMWHSSDGSLSPVDADMYKLEELLPELHRLLRERVQWESFFSMAAITPLRLVYEDFCAAGLSDVVLKVARHVGFELKPHLVGDISASTTKTSAGAQEAIALRLREDCANNEIWPQLFPRSAASARSRQPADTAV